MQFIKVNYVQTIAFFRHDLKEQKVITFAKQQFCTTDEYTDEGLLKYSNVGAGKSLMLLVEVYFVSNFHNLIDDKRKFS